MIQCVDYNEFEALVKRLEKVEANYSLLKALLLSEQWLNRTQAMKALKCSDKTLKRLTHPDFLVHKYVGSKPYYEIDSVRNYLVGRKLGVEEVDYRVICASRAY